MRSLKELWELLEKHVEGSILQCIISKEKEGLINGEEAFRLRINYGENIKKSVKQLIKINSL